MTARLEDFKPDTQVVYRDGQGTIDTQILFRDKEAELEIVSGGRRWRWKRALANSIGCPESTTLRSLNAHA